MRSPVFDRKWREDIPIGTLSLPDDRAGRIAQGLRDGSLRFDPAFVEAPDGTVTLAEISIVPNVGEWTIRHVEDNPKPEA